MRDLEKRLLAARPVHIGALSVRFNALIALCVVMTCGMFINLGLWQLDRAASKRQHAANWQAALDAPAESLLAIDPDALIDNQPLRLQGRYLEQQVAFLVLFQFFQGQPGYELVSPFRLQDDGRLVLVSRGWIAPAADGSPPLIPELDQSVEIVARVHLPELPPQPGQVSDEQWPLRVARLSVEQAAQLLGEPVYPHLLRLEAGQPGVQQRHWRAPDFGTRTHYGYAAQWFLFTALLLIAALLLSSNLISLWRDRKRV